MNLSNKLVKKARKLGQEYDVFASVLIAQAILESGNGSSLYHRHPIITFSVLKEVIEKVQ